MNLVFEDIILSKNLQILIAVTTSFIVAYQAVPLIINICKNTGLLETPLKRSSHDEPTPTFGGVAIFAGIMIGYFLWNFGDEGVLLHKVFVGVTILFFLGIKDDLYALSAVKKLITQILASSIVIIGSDLRITHIFGIMGINELPYFVSVLFTIFIFVALINSFNLIDGIDGLSSGIGMICCGFLGWWFLSNDFWSLACLSLCTSASLLAFMRYNLSKSQRIFMGDTGSLLIGYIITVLAIKYIHYNVNHEFAENSIFVSAPILVIVLLSVPMFDSLRVFGLRIFRGKSPFEADRLHMHHLVVDNGLSHASTSVIFYTFTVAFTIFSFLLRLHVSNYIMVLVVFVTFVCYSVLGYRLEIRRVRVHRTTLEKRQEENEQISKNLTAQENIGQN
jgi:UDP-N-acetylmuramyl pentapeptide phosphotransferase/UDP-N-acetylglucosamine-1-phosphate transferase